MMCRINDVLLSDRGHDWEKARSKLLKQILFE